MSLPLPRDLKYHLLQFIDNDVCNCSISRENKCLCALEMKNEILNILQIDTRCRNINIGHYVKSFKSREDDIYVKTLVKYDALDKIFIIEQNFYGVVYSRYNIYRKRKKDFKLCRNKKIVAKINLKNINHFYNFVSNKDYVDDNGKYNLFNIIKLWIDKYKNFIK